MASFQEEFRKLLEAHGIAYDDPYVWDWKGLFRPFRARVSVWVPLTQAVGLGFVVSPLWGSPAGPETRPLTDG